MNPILELMKAARAEVEHLRPRDSRPAKREVVMALAYLDSAILLLSKAEAQRPKASEIPEGLRALIAAWAPRPKEVRKLEPVPAGVVVERLTAEEAAADFDMGSGKKVPWAPLPPEIEAAMAPAPEPDPDTKRDAAVAMDDRRDPLGPPDPDEILF